MTVNEIATKRQCTRQLVWKYINRHRDTLKSLDGFEEESRAFSITGEACEFLMKKMDDSKKSGRGAPIGNQNAKKVRK